MQSHTTQMRMGALGNMYPTCHALISFLWPEERGVRGSSTTEGIETSEIDWVMWSSCVRAKR